MAKPSSCSPDAYTAVWWQGTCKFISAVFLVVFVFGILLLANVFGDSIKTQPYCESNCWETETLNMIVYNGAYTFCGFYVPECLCIPDGADGDDETFPSKPINEWGLGDWTKAAAYLSGEGLQDDVCEDKTNPVWYYLQYVFVSLGGLFVLVQLCRTCCCVPELVVKAKALPPQMMAGYPPQGYVMPAMPQMQMQQMQPMQQPTVVVTSAV